MVYKGLRVCTFLYFPLQSSAHFLVTYLELPQSAHVIAAFKAGWHHALIQASLDAGQTRGACPDHCYSVHHDGAA